MDISATTQGQGVNSNTTENNQKIDNDVSQHNTQESQGDTKFTVSSNTEQNMSETQVGDTETSIEANGEPVASTSSENNDRLLLCFELSTDRCVLKSVKEKDVVAADKKCGSSGDNADSSTSSSQVIGSSSQDKVNTKRSNSLEGGGKLSSSISHEDKEINSDEEQTYSNASSEILSQNTIDTNNLDGSHLGNRLDNHIKSKSSTSSTDTTEISDATSSESQREITTKISENVLNEVEEEVNKLNISGGEPKSKQQSSENSSKVVVKNATQSLKNLMAYEGDSDSEQSDTDLEEVPCDGKPEGNKPSTQKSWRKNQEDSSGTSDSECDSSTSTLSSDSESDSDNSDGEFNNSDGDSASVIDASDDGIRTESPVLNKDSDKGAVKKTNKSVFDFQEYLPPIPDLSKLNVNAGEEFMHIGRITAVIAELVTVEAIPGTPAFDLDSMLFIDDQSNKKPMGPIYDVLGPVSEPIYCVRFNSEDEIKKLGIRSGMKVYAAPKSDEFSKFVFVKELLRIKGTDASWLNDQETPVEMAEFSDDEQERQARRAGKWMVKRKLEDSSLERHKKYEKTMNQCNTLNTRVCRLMDAQKNLSRQIKPSQKDDVATAVPPPGCLELPDVPAEFNPTVPPPGFSHPSPYSYPSQFALCGPSSSTPGQQPTFNTLSSYNSQNGSYGSRSVFGAPTQFGSFYANQPPAPNSLGPPPARWQQCDNFRRGRHNQRAGQRQNSDNYFTNNSRNFRGAGPSYQPF